VEKMNSTPKCVTETLELEAAREEIADILSDAEQRDNYKVNPELGKTAFDVANIPDNEAVDLCNQALGSYGKSLDRINGNPLKIVREIGDLLQSFREDKTKGSCK
jgi:hypothetical protein